MSFFKDMFKRWEDRFEDSKKEESPKNIAEPVISFVECFKKNPRRFRMETEPSHFGTKYLLTDRFSNKKFILVCCHYSDHYHVGFNITEDEKSFIREHIVMYYKKRYEEYKSLVDIRSRKKLYEIYKQ